MVDVEAHAANCRMANIINANITLSVSYSVYVAAVTGTFDEEYNISVAARHSRQTS